MYTTSEERNAKRTANKERALQSFLDNKNKIDLALATIAAASAEHFSRNPDDITWADAGDLSHWAEKLNEIVAAVTGVTK